MKPSSPTATALPSSLNTTALKSVRSLPFRTSTGFQVSRFPESGDQTNVLPSPTAATVFASALSATAFRSCAATLPGLAQSRPPFSETRTRPFLPTATATCPSALNATSSKSSAAWLSRGARPPPEYRRTTPSSPATRAPRQSFEKAMAFRSEAVPLSTTLQLSPPSLERNTTPPEPAARPIFRHRAISCKSGSISGAGGSNNRAARELRAVNTPGAKICTRDKRTVTAISAKTSHISHLTAQRNPFARRS